MTALSRTYLQERIMSTDVEVNLGKWKDKADPVSLRAFGNLLGLHLSQREAVLLIEMVDGPYVCQDQIVRVTGERRAEILGLKIQSILNRMITEYEQLLVSVGVDLYPGVAKSVCVDQETKDWWEKR